MTFLNWILTQIQKINLLELLTTHKLLTDNIFYNSLEHLTLSGNVVYALTDHLPNFLIKKIHFLTYQSKELQKRLFHS